jgi:hypothetical protein
MLLLFKKTTILSFYPILQLRINIYCINQLNKVLVKTINILELNSIVR